MSQQITCVTKDTNAGRSYNAALEIRGIKRIILALDNDGGTGIGNTEDICRRYNGEEIKVFVIDPPLMTPHKDPDEYVKAHGVDAFKKLMEKAERGFQRKFISAHCVIRSGRRRLRRTSRFMLFRRSWGIQALKSRKEHRTEY